MNIARVSSVVGKLVLVISCTLAVPALVALSHGEQDAFWAFLTSIGIGSVFALALQVAGRGASENMFRREGMAVVALAWIVCTFVGCLPYIFTGVIESPINAYFETMSGFTTTGASVLESSPNEPFPRSILFWRCLTNWLGGVGIVVLFVALLPALGVGGRLLFNLEVPGVGEKGFAPRIHSAATVLWVIYTILTAVEVGALMLAGLDVFDAVCHSLSTMATGGFSPHSASVGHYNSSAVRIIVTVFMFLAGVNFTLYYQLRLGNWRVIWRDSELRCYVGILLIVSLLIAWDLGRAGVFDGVGDSLLASTFTSVSIGTTTGFATEDFNRWPDFSRFLLVLLMFVGGCAGSTAGGPKVIRIMVILKAMLLQLGRHIRPRRVSSLTVGGSGISEEIVHGVTMMFCVFVATFLFGGVALLMMGLDLQTSLSASIACVGNIGPGLGSVGPTGNYADVPTAGKVLLSVLMLVGRLEVFTALSLFAPGLWRD